jgi:acetoin utilization protein AcuB
MITRNDLFKAIVSQSGVRKKGFQFGFLMEDRPGSLREVTDVVRKHGARVASIMSSNQDVAEGFRRVSIVAFDIERDKLPQIKQELEQKCRILYVVDRRENRREISTNR